MDLHTTFCIGMPGLSGTDRCIIKITLYELQRIVH